MSSQKCDFSNFCDFSKNCEKLEKSQFLLKLTKSSVRGGVQKGVQPKSSVRGLSSQNCDFSNFCDFSKNCEKLEKSQFFVKIN